MTDGGVDRSVECTGNINAMISAFECVHDGWGKAVLVGVPHKEAVFKTLPINFLCERTLTGTFYGHYKPRTDIPGVVEQYMNKVPAPTFYCLELIIFSMAAELTKIESLNCRSWSWRSSSPTRYPSPRSTRPSI